jgi:hypothetical protein
MLAYVDSLCAALLARDQAEIRRLLSLPFATRLPQPVREEALAIAKGKTSSFMAPVNTLHFYYKLSHLIGEDSDALDIEPDRASVRQIELSLQNAVNS